MKTGNEADVREDFITPFLVELGYKRGTANDILREEHLKYPKAFLGRKKKTDPDLTGKADYILSVLGYARWVIEAKAPGQKIDRDEVEQALTYARHPEVSAWYVVITNSLETHIYRATQRFDDGALHKTTQEDPVLLARNLVGLLGPDSIRRDCNLPIVDLGTPLAPGLRSSVEIVKGNAVYEDFNLFSSVQLPQPQQNMLDQLQSDLRGFNSALTGGRIYRNEQSKIVVDTVWHFESDDLKQFSQSKNFEKIQFISLEEEISIDIDDLTPLDAVFNVEINKSDLLYSPFETQVTLAQFNATMRTTCRANAAFVDGTVKGMFNIEHDFEFEQLPQLRIWSTGSGSFNLVVN